MARLLSRARARLRDTVSGDDRLFYWLESPRIERLGRGGALRLSGWALWYGDREITEIAVVIDGGRAAVAPVDGARPEIARNAATLPVAAHCGFTVDLDVPAEARLLALTACFSDGRSEPLLEIDLAEERRRRDELDGMAARVDAVPLPGPDLVHLTQGLHDPEFYRCTIIPAALNTAAYLEHAGHDPGRPRRVLDFGCGSGRLLVGWHALAGGHALAGCDINADLVGWARANLPSAIDLRVSLPLPPLPYADASFDTVFAVSVFTHLSLDSQRRWVDELRRIVTPGGALLVTLHGESYVPHIFPDRPELADELRRRGHVVTPVGEVGSNQFASLHTRGFARELFRGFELARFYPNGRVAGCRLPYPAFILQDVYVLTRRR